MFLMPGGVVGSAGETILWSNYPVLPWLELVTLGIVFGKWLGEDPRKAFSRAWKLGAAFLVAFVVVRYLDGFGNIRPRMSNSWIDFLNPVKYPPSIAFTLMTTGVNLIVLWLFSRAGTRLRRMFSSRWLCLDARRCSFMCCTCSCTPGWVTCWRPEVPASRPCIRSGCWGC